MSRYVRKSAQIFKAAAIALLAGLAPPRAAAHWEYTVWGMTEAQVVAASNGAARALPEDRRRAVAPARMTYAVEGRLEEAGLVLDVAFAFDEVTGGLVCVSYATRLRHQGPALRDWIARRFGPPAQRGRDPATGEESLAWREPDNIDLQILPLRGAIALHCARGT